MLKRLFLILIAIILSTSIATAAPTVRYHTQAIDGIDIFYREAGDVKKPAIVLLHGFPTSSHMYRDLIPQLAANYHVIAPDYPGFGYSAMPDRRDFTYSFDNYAKIIGQLLAEKNIKRYALYVFDYGAPVGYRIFASNPKAVSALIVQNGNAYEDGLGDFWKPLRAYWASGSDADREAIRWLTSRKATDFQYSDGFKDPSLVSPDAAQHDQSLLDRPGNAEIQLDLFYDYRTNLPLYPKWQALFRQYQPPTLVVWGKNDTIFIQPGATAYRRDLPRAQIELLDTGHFALESHGNVIAAKIKKFLGKNLIPAT